jgi:hypothetical protein
MVSIGTIKYKNGSSWVDILHTVGSVWLSNSSTSPASLFGGTWTQLTNAVLRAATSTEYIGSDTHTLTINEMPSHNHKVTANSGGVIFTKIGSVNDGTAKSTTVDWGPGITVSYTGGGRCTLYCATFV